MPDEMTGLELAAQLRKQKPGLRVVFTSGYFQDSGSQRFDPSDEYPFLHKPYDPSALAAIVRQTLDDLPPFVTGTETLTARS
jgi:CheY-like chemotaxis protein